MKADYIYTHDDLKKMQGWSLERKIQVLQTRYMEWYMKQKGKVYVSFSGGLDSTVMLDAIARVHKQISKEPLTVVFVDTGLEFPEIKEFILQYIDWIQNTYGIKIKYEKLRPKLTFYQVLLEYGYPVVSKEISKIIYGARHSEKKRQSYINKLKGLNPDGTYSKFKQRYLKWEFMLDAPYEASNRCCYFIKEKPCVDFERKSGLKPIVATMAADSAQRKDGWRKTGCNAFSGKRPISKPMSVWTTQDVLQYQVRFRVPYCSVYGDIVEETRVTPKKKIVKKTGRLLTTGESHTGCMFCLFGAHLDNADRIRRMKKTHPKQYQYCVYGGEYKNGKFFPNKNGLGEGEILKYIGIDVTDPNETEEANEV